MRVEFESTVEDVLAVLQRASSLVAPVARRYEQLNVVAAAALSGVLVYFLIPDTMTVKLVFAAFGTIAGAVVAIKMRADLKQRIQRRLAEQAISSRSSPRVAVELRSDGVLVEQGDVETLFRWTGLNSTAEDDGRIVVSGPIGVIGVPLRAFSSPHEARAFLEEAQQRIQTASQDRR